jgi:hypothetical protein
MEGEELTGKPINDRNKVKPIARGGEEHLGTLASGAFDEYEISGIAQQLINVITHRSDNSTLFYRVCFTDSQGVPPRPGSSQYRSGIQSTQFTPTSGGNYVIRVEGLGFTHEFGDYSISIPE